MIFAVHPAGADEVAQQVEVAVELPVDGEQVAQLAVVDAHVGVDQVVRRGLVRNGCLQVIQDHIRVVEVVAGCRSEPVAIVPFAHHCHRLVHVLVEHAVAAVGLQDAAHFGLGEAKNLVELWHRADVGADVEAAGDVVHGDRRHAGDEQALDAAAVAGAGLQSGEEVAVEAAAMGEGVIRLGAAIGEYGVGEIVVLVDQHVQRDAVPGGELEQFVQFAVDRRIGEDTVDHRLGEQVRVGLQRVTQHDETVGLEPLSQGLQRVVERRKVEAQNDVAVAVRGGLPPDFRAGEQRLEPVRGVAIVVVSSSDTQHDLPNRRGRIRNA